jgi:glycosyltransferase involved in cell wall biosynthesis
MTEDKKIKIMTISDHPLHPSGVGIQTRYFIQSLLDTGEFEFISLAGAQHQPDHTPVKTEKYGDSWKIFPVHEFGSQEIVRSVLRTERPDILWIMTDPRFYEWLWQIDDEIRSLVPIVYYHVWDNYPYPSFNKKFYDSNDTIVSISKVTSDIVRTVSPEVDEVYLPHTVDTEVFKPLPEEDIENFKQTHFHKDDDRVMFFWNNRNARRKQSNSLIFWFKQFLDEVGHDKACLLMHTDPKDPHGPNLEAVLEELELNKGQVMISPVKYPPERLALLYNLADCTVNISDAEGFGLSTLESLACGTPIIVNMTGGLQEQVTDGKKWFGVGIEPSSKAIIGSQQVPFIFEDRISEEDFVNALKKIYEMKTEDRKKLGQAGLKHFQKNYNMEDFSKNWYRVMKSVYKEKGSWDNRKNYKSWRLEEL